LPSESWRIAMAMFVLVACTQEVFIIGNHFLWLLLVAVLTPHFSISELLQGHGSHPRRSDQGFQPTDGA
jgi:hypothetical protein